MNIKLRCISKRGNLAERQLGDKRVRVAATDALSPKITLIA